MISSSAEKSASRPYAYGKIAGRTGEQKIGLFGLRVNQSAAPEHEIAGGKLVPG